MNARRPGPCRWLPTLIVLVTLFPSLTLSQERVVLEHKASGRRLAGTFAQGKVDGRRVFQADSGETLFLNVGDWQVVERLSRQTGASGDDSRKAASPSDWYSEEHVAAPDEAVATIHAFVEELEEARPAQQAEVHDRARIDRAVKRLRGALLTKPVLEFRLRTGGVSPSRVEGQWAIELTGPLGMPAERRWRTTIEARLTQEQAKALSAGRTVTVRFRAELIEVSESDPNALFLLAGDPAGWLFDTGDARCQVRLTPLACRVAEAGDTGPWIPAYDRKVGFFGITSNRGRLVYVVDRSGSMTDSNCYAKRELKRSIASLDIHCQFHVIFYSAGPAVEMPTRRLVHATRRNKRLAFEFIDSIIAQGETDPSRALDRAFAVEPDVIYLLTDGEFDVAVADRVARLNKEKKVTVHTIGFLYRIGEKVLKRIARENNGRYTFISEADLARIIDR